MNTTTVTPTAEALAEHMPLVRGIAAQLMRRLPRSVQLDDLVAAGTLGLFHALRSTSHTSPEMLGAYLRIRVRGAIVDELRRHDWSPRRRKASPSAAVAVVGFDDLTPDATAKLHSDEGRGSPLEGALARQAHVALHAAVDELPTREAAIVRMRYFDEMPAKGIARVLGLSEARVSQLHARATNRLRELLADDAEIVKVAA
jgi:RNA polymerase sigma factor for flagellar operon FliA